MLTWLQVRCLELLNDSLVSMTATRMKARLRNRLTRRLRPTALRDTKHSRQRFSNSPLPLHTISTLYHQSHSVTFPVQIHLFQIRLDSIFKFQDT